MRRTLVTSAICAVVFTATPALAQQAAGASADAQHAADKADSGEKFTFDGQAALWTVASKADTSKPSASRCT